MSKALLIAGGILNTVAFFFHLMLGFQIRHLSQVAQPHRAIMEALNVGVALSIFFFAYVSLFHGKELLATCLGRVVLVLVSLFYLSRAAEEFFLFQFTPAIFVSCLLVGAVYAALLVLALKENRQPVGTAETSR